jgi:hypothetical protein
MARIKVKSVSGQPSVILPRKRFADKQRLMRPLRSIPTLMKRDEAKASGDEAGFRATLMRAGVGKVKTMSASINRQKPQSPPSFSSRGAGKTVRAAKSGPLKKR